MVADDSVFMRMLIKDILETDPSIRVCSQAKDGKEAGEFTLRDNPDVVLMDITMGQYDGIFGVKKIMESHPKPIIILSAIGNTDMTPVLDALSAGAIDYLNKPAESTKNFREVGQELIQKVKVAKTIEIKSPGYESKSVNTNPHSFGSNLNYEVIVIGSSTGGPTAVEQVITNLPGNLAVPVVIAQHMPANFVPSFAERLNNLTPLTVKLARKDDVLERGKVLIAPGSRNMIVRREGEKVVVDFSGERFKHFNFPSVDCLMNSVADVYGSRSIGVILTGMGRDGTEGCEKIYKKGGYVVAQSESTCVVFGMPKSAIEAGFVKQVVPLQEIGMFLVSCLS